MADQNQINLDITGNADKLKATLLEIEQMVARIQEKLHFDVAPKGGAGGGSGSSGNAADAVSGSKYTAAFANASGIAESIASMNLGGNRYRDPRTGRFANLAQIQGFAVQESAMSGDMQFGVTPSLGGFIKSAFNTGVLPEGAQDVAKFQIFDAIDSRARAQINSATAFAKRQQRLINQGFVPDPNATPLQTLGAMGVFEVSQIAAEPQRIADRERARAEKLAQQEEDRKERQQRAAERNAERAQEKHDNTWGAWKRFELSGEQVKRRYTGDVGAWDSGRVDVNSRSFSDAMGEVEAHERAVTRNLSRVSRMNPALPDYDPHGIGSDPTLYAPLTPANAIAWRNKYIGAARDGSLMRGTALGVSLAMSRGLTEYADNETQFRLTGQRNLMVDKQSLFGFGGALGGGVVGGLLTPVLGPFAGYMGAMVGHSVGSAVGGILGAPEQRTMLMNRSAMGLAGMMAMQSNDYTLRNRDWEETQDYGTPGEPRRHHFRHESRVSPSLDIAKEIVNVAKKRAELISTTYFPFSDNPEYNKESPYAMSKEQLVSTYYESYSALRKGGFDPETLVSSIPSEMKSTLQQRVTTSKSASEIAKNYAKGYVTDAEKLLDDSHKRWVVGNAKSTGSITPSMSIGGGDLISSVGGSSNVDLVSAPNNPFSMYFDKSRFDTLLKTATGDAATGRQQDKLLMEAAKQLSKAGEKRPLYQVLAENIAASKGADGENIFKTSVAPVIASLGLTGGNPADMLLKHGAENVANFYMAITPTGKRPQYTLKEFDATQAQLDRTTRAESIASLKIRGSGEALEFARGTRESAMLELGGKDSVGYMQAHRERLQATYLKESQEDILSYGIPMRQLQGIRERGMMMPYSPGLSYRFAFASMGLRGKQLRNLKSRHQAHMKAGDYTEEEQAQMVDQIESLKTQQTADMATLLNGAEDRVMALSANRPSFFGRYDSASLAALALRNSGSPITRHGSWGKQLKYQNDFFRSVTSDDFSGLDAMSPRHGNYKSDVMDKSGGLISALDRLTQAIMKTGSMPSDQKTGSAFGGLNSNLNQTNLPPIVSRGS